MRVARGDVSRSYEQQAHTAYLAYPISCTCATTCSTASFLHLADDCGLFASICAGSLHQQSLRIFNWTIMSAGQENARSAAGVLQRGGRCSRASAASELPWSRSSWQGAALQRKQLVICLHGEANCSTCMFGLEPPFCCLMKGLCSCNPLKLPQGWQIFRKVDFQQPNVQGLASLTLHWD